jgi:hypothetical protein
VDGLKETLAVQEVEVQKKNEAADKLIQIVGVETEKVSKEKTFGKILFCKNCIIIIYTYVFLVYSQ